MIKKNLTSLGDEAKTLFFLHLSLTEIYIKLGKKTKKIRKEKLKRTKKEEKANISQRQISYKQII